MGTSYTNTRRKSGKPSKFQQSFRRFIFLAAIIISCAAVYQLITYIRAEKNTTPKMELPYGSLSELTDPATFTPAYLAVNCDATLLERTQTIRVTGHIVSGDNNEPFTLIKKRPDKMLFTIDRGSHEMTFGVSGDTVWRRIRAPQHEDLFARIEGVEAKAWLEQRRFFDRIISASLGEGRISEIKVASWENSDCLQVTIQATDGAPTEILIDPQTMYPIAELQTLPDGTTQQTVFSDYRVVGGMPLPFSMQTSTDDETTNHIVLDAASLNSGVLSKLFEIPEALLEK